MRGRLNSEVESAIRCEIGSFLDAILDELGERAAFDRSLSVRDPTRPIFHLLTGRRYGHLGRKKSERYREEVSTLLQRNISLNEPVRFFYDLGPGYHASLVPGKDALSFAVGLGELLALHNVVSFCNDVQQTYEPGARFHLVIDNLCGWATNDVPIGDLEDYVDRLRHLVDNIGARDLVTVLVESENADREEYSARLARVPEAAPRNPPTDDEVENVARFLGRTCTPREASQRMARYERTTIATEALLARAIHGVRLTQRAGPTTLGFRAFSGGDQRIQVGQVAFGHRIGGGIKPLLLTSRNVDRFHLIEFDFSASLPRPMSSIAYAATR